MKTAVQIAVEKLEKLIPPGNQLLIRAILIEELKNEKEQMVDFAFKTYQGVSQKCEVPKNLIAESKAIFESNFDRIYNQNK